MTRIGSPLTTPLRAETAKSAFRGHCLPGPLRTLIESAGVVSKAAGIFSALGGLVASGPAVVYGGLEAGKAAGPYGLIAGGILGATLGLLSLFAARGTSDGELKHD